jgi:hypothetical protein
MIRTFYQPTTGNFTNLPSSQLLVEAASYARTASPPQCNRNKGIIVPYAMVVSRRFALRAVTGSWITGSYALLARAPGDDFWNTEQPDKWTPEEIQELTSKSPWAKPVTAQINGNSPLSPAGRVGRRGGLGTTTGRGAGANSGEGSPKFTGVVRWASAKPIRLALKLQFPPSLADHFVISVSGLPTMASRRRRRYK